MIQYSSALFLLSCLLMVDSAESSNQLVTVETPKDFVERYQFEDWRGKYSFSSEETVLFEQSSLNPLRVLEFGYSGIDWSHCIVIAAIGDAGALTELYKSNIVPDGVTPTFEGLDVLVSPDANGCILSLRWRIPGNGGNRLVQSLKYINGKINLIGETSSYHKNISADTVKVWVFEKNTK